MRTVLFLDVENMGDKKVRGVVNQMIAKFSPERVEVATATELPKNFRDIERKWTVCRCAPGRDAADHVLQKHIKQAVSDGVERIILITNDFGFIDVCRKVLYAGRRLCLVVRKLGKLAKKAIASAKNRELLEIFDIDARVLTGNVDATVFVRDSRGELHEVPFLNGMRVEDFVKILKQANLYHKHVTHWIKGLFLEVQSGHVFVSDKVFA